MADFLTGLVMSGAEKRIRVKYEDAFDAWWTKQFGEPLSQAMMPKVHSDDVVEAFRQGALWAYEDAKLIISNKSLGDVETETGQ